MPDTGVKIVALLLTSTPLFVWNQLEAGGGAIPLMFKVLSEDVQMSSFPLLNSVLAALLCNLWVGGI